MNWDYMTHVPMLYEAARVTSGDVIELGVGLGSTPLLHALVTHGTKPRHLVSVDDDENWLSVIRSRFSNECHEYLHVTNWSDQLRQLAETKPSLVFVDQGKVTEMTESVKQRMISVRVFKDSEVIVIHDSEHVYNSGDKDFLSFMKDSFKYIIADDHTVPQTLWLSNTKKPDYILRRY